MADRGNIDLKSRGREPRLIQRMLTTDFWERRANANGEFVGGFLRDVFLRPSVGVVSAIVIGGVLALVIWLTVEWAPGAAVRNQQGEGDITDVITPEGGWAAILAVSLLALIAGWEQVAAGWIDTLRRYLPAAPPLSTFRPPSRGRGLPGADREQPEGELKDERPRLVRLIAPPVLVTALLISAVGTSIGFVIRSPSLFLSLVDWFLARLVAPCVGAAWRGWFWRYAAFLFVILSAAAAGLYVTPASLNGAGLPAWLAFAWLLVAMIAILAVARRWSWVERDRDAFLINRRDDSQEGALVDRNLRLGFTEDLRDEALTGLVALFALIPLTLMQLELLWPGTFEIAEAADRDLTLAGYPLFGWTLHGTFGPTAADNPLSWYAYFGAELAKAVPFVDWSEVFRVPNGMPIRPGEGRLGPSVVFGLRAGLDLLVLAAVVQALAIAGRTRQVRRSFESGQINLLDPFDEILYLRRIEGSRVNSPGAREIDQPGVVAFPAQFDRQKLLDGAAGRTLGGARGRQSVHLAALSVAARMCGRNWDDEAADKGGWAATELVDALAERLETSADPLLRRRALTLCGEIGRLTPEHCGRLADAASAVLADRRANADLRGFAAREIGRLGGGQQADALATAKGDVVLEAACAVALAKLGDPRAAARLEGLPEESEIGAMRAHGLDLLDSGRRLPLPALTPIPAGGFTMGSPEDEPERLRTEGPQHERRIAAFELGRCATTFEEYDVYCRFRGLELPSDRGWGRGRRPAINVSWSEAQVYHVWLSRVTGERWRLPSEAEWEYACRAGASTPFWWGATISTDQANYDGNFAYAGGEKTGVNRAHTMEVDAFEANPFSLHQTHGNVWEWCQDQWRGSYGDAPPDETARLSKWGLCVLRGGSWSFTPRALRSAQRLRFDRTIRLGGIGFRSARTPRA